LFELMDREGDWEGLDERAMDAGCLKVLVHRILDGARPHLLAGRWSGDHEVRGETGPVEQLVRLDVGGRGYRADANSRVGTTPMTKAPR
jgi:hypothetical protein